MPCGVSGDAAGRHDQLLKLRYNTADPTISTPLAPSAAQVEGADGPRLSSGIATTNTAPRVSAAASRTKGIISTGRPLREVPCLQQAMRYADVRCATTRTH